MVTTRGEYLIVGSTEIHYLELPKVMEIWFEQIISKDLEIARLRKKNDELIEKISQLSWRDGEELRK